MTLPLTDEQRRLMQHVLLFGSAGYPIVRYGRSRGWSWGTPGCPGPPVVFKTKREAVASFEAYCDVLRARLREDRALEQAIDSG